MSNAWHIDEGILNNNLNDSVSYKEYFHALGYSDDDRIYFRDFSEKKKTEKGHTGDELLKRFDLRIGELRAANQRDRGIFYVVNGDGQSDRDVHHARAQFVDMDDYPFDEQIRRINDFPLEPSIIVKTRKSLHCYWILDKGQIRYFRDIQKRLIRCFGSDQTIQNESRVMRLYGFEHRKQEPVVVKLIKFSPEIRYTQKQLRDVLPALEEKERKKPAKPGGEKVPIGQRHNYVMRRIGEYINRLGDSASDDSILSLLEADFRENCAEPDNVDEDFRTKYKKTIREYRQQRAEEKKDPDFWKYARKAYLHYTGVTEFDAAITSWDEVAAAGRRGQAEGLVFEKRLQPIEFTDLAQAQAFVENYGECIRWTSATQWLVYNGRKWEESGQEVRSLVHRFLKEQLAEANKGLREARKKYDTAVEFGDDTAQRQARGDVSGADKYKKQVLKYQQSQRISAVLTESAPAALIDVSALDADPFMLNTPAGTIDLKTGNLLPHKATDYCTKITACGVSGDGAEEWNTFLSQVTGRNRELEEYLQLCMGMAAIGEVLQEKLIIAYGSGGNGKSTFFNVVARVLGDYAGYLSAETLTVGDKRNNKPELAELRGKRLVIASELEEGQRLNTAIVKKICSTDMIQAEKKFKDPFSFRPSHSVILFTNHLPKVGTTDSGTWDRLIVIPFQGRFRSTSKEILNYADVLFNHAGGAILRWVVEGAQKFIAADYKLKAPQCVIDSVSEYRDDNDWLRHFITSKCETGPGKRAAAGKLYDEYRRFCHYTSQFARDTGTFKAAMVNAGYEWKKLSAGIFYSGLNLVEEPDDF